MKVAGLLIGSVFGALLWLSGMADYDVIHRGLLFREPHLYLMMVASVGTAAPLLWLLERRGVRTLLGGTIAVTRDRPERQHVLGGLTFGVGWALAGTCPGAVAAMAAGGELNALWVMAGIAGGTLLRDGLERRATSAARRTPDEPAAAVLAGG